MLQVWPSYVTWPSDGSMWMREEEGYKYAPGYINHTFCPGTCSRRWRGLTTRCGRPIPPGTLPRTPPASSSPTITDGRTTSSSPDSTSADRYGAFNEAYWVLCNTYNLTGVYILASQEITPPPSNFFCSHLSFIKVFPSFFSWSPP